MTTNLDHQHLAKKLVPHVMTVRYETTRAYREFTLMCAEDEHVKWVDTKHLTMDQVDLLVDSRVITDRDSDSPLFSPGTSREEIKEKMIKALESQLENEQHALISNGYQTLEEQVAFRFTGSLMQGVHHTLPRNGVISRTDFDTSLAEGVQNAYNRFGSHTYGTWDRHYVLKKKFEGIAGTVLREEIYLHLTPENPVILLNIRELTLHGDDIKLKDLLPPRSAHAR